jgi:hypothetical protein
VPDVEVIELNTELPVVFSYFRFIGVGGHAMVTQKKDGGRIAIKGSIRFHEGFADLAGDGKPVWCKYGVRSIDKPELLNDVADPDAVRKSMTGITLFSYEQYGGKATTFETEKAVASRPKGNKLGDLKGILKDAKP